jgi:hypothetical protein
MEDTGMSYIAPDEMVEGADIEGLTDIDEGPDESIIDNSGNAYYDQNYSALEKARTDRANELGIKPIDFNKY